MSGVNLERLLATLMWMLTHVLILGIAALLLVNIFKSATRPPAMAVFIKETSNHQSCWDDFCLNQQNQLSK
ncbi:MAG: hypothetical protein EBV69_08890 [Oxalobacteraceae bacterium]|nr:hypothetical protein [Oxalobacteraceae bacterium]